VLALVAGVGGHFLMGYSLPHLPLWVSSTMTLSIPVISTAAAAVFLGEEVAPLQVLGMVVVLLTLGMAIRVATPPTPGAS
jgi:drug/metabolite transporter (DMT)-like permease